MEEMTEKEITNYFIQQAKEGKTAEQAIYNLLELYGAENKMPDFRKEGETAE